jgi:hypothetical protein
MYPEPWLQGACDAASWISCACLLFSWWSLPIRGCCNFIAHWRI